MRLDALLRPRSVAILGASERPSIGRSLIEALDTIGFRGAIYPINPRYETLLGRKCYASVAELPPDVDTLAICVNHARVLEHMRPAADCRRFGWSHVVSSGNEAVLAAVDFLEYLIDDETTRVIAMFLETVRQPERFVAALDRAADRGKPVVVLKVGRHERTRRAITTHTGGLAGEARVFSAVLRAHRAIEVADMEGLTEVLACAQGERWPRGRRLCVMTASG